MNISKMTLSGRGGAVSAQAPALRLLACGAAGAGKSALIGRLLQDLGSAAVDQMAPEKGDAEFRPFSTDRRSFLIADAPGGQQRLSDLAMAAANSDLAILLVDARAGLVEQALRHLAIISMLGVRHVVLAVNKMDLVDYSEAVFNAVVADFTDHASGLGFRTLAAIPMSALSGVNVASHSTLMAWRHGPCLLDYLETVEFAEDAAEAPLRFPIEGIDSSNPDIPGFSGPVMSGRVKVGDEICIADNGKTAHVARILGAQGDVASAGPSDAVRLVFAEKAEASRGDMICHVADRPAVVEQFAAHLLWMGEEKLFPGRSYLIAINGRTVAASVTEIKYRLNVENHQQMAAKTLQANEIGFCNLAAAQPLSIDPFEHFRNTGAFLLLDRVTNVTVAIGTIAFPLRRASNVHLQAMSVTKEVRAGLKGQKPAVLWFTGLSGSGKSTIANLVETRLAGESAHTIALDGDNLRHGLNRDLGFTDADRVENIRRVGEVSKLMADAGLIVLCSFISPFEAERRMVRELLGPGEFVEVFVDTPLETCIQRDRKGLYKRALAGEIKTFTGVTQPYERPEKAEIVLTLEDGSAETMADRIVEYLRVNGIVASA
jgi:bifunctional enzyme CysN/CysC